MSDTEHTIAQRRARVAEMELEIVLAGEADAWARVRDLEADVASYRDVLQIALYVAHTVTMERDRLRVQTRELRREALAAREGRTVAA